MFTFYGVNIEMFKKNKSTDEYSDKTPLIKETKAEKEERKQQPYNEPKSKDSKFFSAWSKKEK